MGLVSDTERTDAAAADGPKSATTRDRVLLAAFWIWAGLLVLAAVAQFLGPKGEGILDALDAKRWFAR